MSTFKTDENNDWIIDKGSLVLLGKNNSDPAAELAQRNRQVLSTFFGEWYLNTQIGVPYFQIVFQKGADLGEIREILKEKILSIPGKYELRALDLNLVKPKRSLRLSYELKVLPSDTIRVRFDMDIIEGSRFEFTASNE